MKEYILGLGNFLERDCKEVKRIMDGKTYMKFQVSWSNMFGNCQLIIKTDYDAPEEDIKRFFLNCMISEFAEECILRRHNSFEEV